MRKTKLRWVLFLFTLVNCCPCASGNIGTSTTATRKMSVISASINLSRSLCFESKMTMRSTIGSNLLGRTFQRMSIKATRIATFTSPFAPPSLWTTNGMSPREGNGRIRLFSSNNPAPSVTIDVTESLQRIAIVGGGLAGLSAAYHILEKAQKSKMGRIPTITILDKAKPGKGGASSVAGGLLHPFSPGGKLIHLGREGMQSSTSLINAASMFRPECVMRDRLYRIALTDKNVEQLEEMASRYPEFATWLTSDQIRNACGAHPSLGGIVLSNGCKVVHVPTYLQGLWDACQNLSPAISWSLIEPSCNNEMQNFNWKDRLREFDTVLFSAGSGLFRDSIIGKEKVTADFPVDLVRGQSIEMNVGSYSGSPSMKYDVSDGTIPNEGVLCGKYIAPLPEKGKVLIGATHEFKMDPLDESAVEEELHKRSKNLSPIAWKYGKIERITIGYRVQSRRGKYGRMPMIGKLSDNNVHHNAWLFTGLSSRGLIYHGIFGEILSDAILDEGGEGKMFEMYPDLAWWKQIK